MRKLLARRHRTHHRLRCSSAPFSSFSAFLCHPIFLPLLSAPLLSSHPLNPLSTLLDVHNVMLLWWRFCAACNCWHQRKCSALHSTSLPSSSWTTCRAYIAQYCVSWGFVGGGSYSAIMRATQGNQFNNSTSVQLVIRYHHHSCQVLMSMSLSMLIHRQQWYCLSGKIAVYCTPSFRPPQHIKSWSRRA